MRIQSTFNIFKIVCKGLCGVLLLVGCSGSKKSNRNDTVLQAYRLIDAQRTPEAISLLENALQEDPNNYEYTAVLASAYSHMAGIKVQKFVPAILQMNKMEKLGSDSSKTKKDDATKEPSGNTERVNQEARDIAQLLARFSGFFEMYASIPVVETADAVYITHAIELLNSLGSKIRPSDAVYRAVLEIILFKQILADELMGDVATQKDAVCRVDLGRVNDTLVKLGKLMIDIFSDVSLANPKKNPDMQKLSSETSNVVSNMTIATTSVTALNDASNMFLSQSAFDNGFGKILECGGN